MTAAVEKTTKRRPRKSAGDTDAVAVVEPTRVIPPELRFTTEPDADDVVPDEADRTIEFDLDGVTCHIITPYKLEECLAQLMEAGARRATTADALFHGRRFLEQVLSGETVAHLQRRLDDQADPFRITHLYDILERIVKVLNERLEEDNRGRRPGRAGRGRR